jgi:hypothetical protein
MTSNYISSAQKHKKKERNRKQESAQRVKQADTHIANEAGPLTRGGNLLTMSLGGENNVCQ